MNVTEVPPDTNAQKSAAANGCRFTIEVRVSDVKTGDEATGALFGVPIDKNLICATGELNVPALSYFLQSMAPTVGLHFEQKRAERLNAQLPAGTVQ